MGSFWLSFLSCLAHRFHPNSCLKVIETMFPFEVGPKKNRKPFLLSQPLPLWVFPEAQPNNFCLHTIAQNAVIWLPLSAKGVDAESRWSSGHIIAFRCYSIRREWMFGERPAVSATPCQSPWLYGAGELKWHVEQRFWLRCGVLSCRPLG